MKTRQIFKRRNSNKNVSNNFHKYIVFLLKLYIPKNEILDTFGKYIFLANIATQGIVVNNKVYIILNNK